VDTIGDSQGEIVAEIVSSYVPNQLPFCVNQNYANGGEFRLQSIFKDYTQENDFCLVTCNLYLMASSISTRAPKFAFSPISTVKLQSYLEFKVDSFGSYC